MSKLLKVNTQCRICGSKKLEKFLSLGTTPLANSFLKKGDFRKEKWFPLEVYFCNNCYLSQLVDIVDKKHLFSHYVYFYSLMPQASEHFITYAKDLIKRFINIPKKQLVLEFGSNDGLLLKAFRENGCQRILGVDPAKNVANAANKIGVPTITDFFSYSLVKKILKKYGKAKVIIANNTLAHINDLHDVAKAVDLIIEEDGVFVFEAPYLVDMFENLAFDSIYHEHLSYLTVSPLVYLFKQYDMDVFNVELARRQGNSIRVFISRRRNFPIKSSVRRLLGKEKKMGLQKSKTYYALAKKIENSKNKLNKILTSLKKKKLRVAAYGSPARGNTILNYCKIGQDVLDYATEELQSKIGLYTPGMHIPVISIDQARENPPDYYLLLAWDYKDSIFKKEKAFIKRGGKFIMPVGGVKVF